MFFWVHPGLYSYETRHFLQINSLQRLFPYSSFLRTDSLWRSALIFQAYFEALFRAVAGLRPRIVVPDCMPPGTKFASGCPIGCRSACFQINYPRCVVSADGSGIYASARWVCTWIHSQCVPKRIAFPSNTSDFPLPDLLQRHLRVHRKMQTGCTSVC